MADYKVDFQELKSKVGIDDVAYELGYRLDRKAGVGRYIEMALGDGKEKRDAIIICNPHDKAAQRFFRRDGSKGMSWPLSARTCTHSMSRAKTTGRR